MERSWIKYSGLLLGQRLIFSKIAKNSDDACKLIEAGFEYVLTSPDGLMIFKKRK